MGKNVPFYISFPPFLVLEDLFRLIYGIWGGGKGCELSSVQAQPD